MQLAIRNDEAARLAEDAGLKVVMNRCPKIEYGRLSSEISWMGVNSRTLSSKRAQNLGNGVQRMSLGERRQQNRGDNVTSNPCARRNFDARTPSAASLLDRRLSRPH